ncbi:unnamed protein product [Adineta ricciae]|uniref:Uncharacterized protein n=1 Tax=Adineta ricciae TaxID=249248 RepID=A0A814Z8W5_ADIRI|nr:unnamed protein product [Adineta ricciae]CAF1239663.1 unnamed protein product [Adineta ricciae]
MHYTPRFVLQAHHIVKIVYYNTCVFSSPSDYEKLKSNKSLGQLIFFLGLSLIAITGVDLSSMSYTIVTSEQSIWPSSGRGIWIGLFVMAVGAFTIIAVREQTHGAFYVLLPYAIVAMIFCLFGLLTSISVLDHYLKDPELSQKENRNKKQGIQFALAGLFIGLFGLTFLFLSCLSCMICWTIPNLCTKYQGRDPEPISQIQSSPPMNYPLTPLGTPRQRLIPNSPRFPSTRQYRV